MTEYALFVEKLRLWGAALLYACALACIPAAIIWFLNSR